MRKLWQCINQFRTLNPQFPAQTMQTFLYIAMKHPEEVPSADLAKHLDVSQSSVSRNLMALGKVARKDNKVPGLALVETWEDVYDRRRKLAGLTFKGQTLYRNLKEALDG